MTEADLVAAIHADPDSDAPRLVYADWLQSRGDPLGEYIALSLQSERGDEAAVRARLAELDYDRVWHERFRGHRTRETERGMVAVLGIDVAQLEPVLVEHLRGTFIRELAIPGSATVLDDRRFAVLRDALACMHLRRLSFGAEVAPEQLARLLVCIFDVEELSLNQPVTDDAARVIAAASLPKLSHLRIHGPPQYRVLGPAGVAELVSGRLPLTSLDLSGTPIGSAGVTAIARGVAPLDTLAIGGVGLDDAAVGALARTPAFARLRRLALASNRERSGLTQAQLAMLIASPYLSRELELAVDGVALGMSPFYFSDDPMVVEVDPMWSGEIPPELAARFRVEVVGIPGP